MPRTPASVTKTSEQPEIMFTLEMREKTRGVWRTRSGSWVSTVTWTVELSSDEYMNFLDSLRGRKARKVASHG